jgi:predicted DNA-binding protein (MmcQ/YjbR family)
LAGVAHDPRDRIPARVLQRVRKICLGLPETTEKTAWGHPTFRVKDKMFASIGGWDYDEAGKPLKQGEKGIRKVTMTMPTLPGEQEALLARGHPFFYPAYVGVRGWIGVEIDGATDWDEIEEIVETAYRKIAPKKLSAQLD